MNPNEPKIQTPFAPEPMKTFSYMELQKTLENTAIIPDDLKSYLNRQEVVERFIKPINQLFAPKEQNISEAWKNLNVTTFTADNTPINKPAMDLLTFLANDLNISIVKAYEYLNIVLKNNPELIKIVLRPDISLQYQNTIENMVVNLISKDRLSLLRGINSAIKALGDISSDRQRVTQDFMIPMLENNSLINALIENYQSSSHSLTSPYFKKNPEIYISSKVKEEFLILSSIFGLFSQNRVRKDLPKIYEKLFGIFIRQKFEGGLNEAMEQMKLSSQNISKMNNEVSDKNGILIIFILMAGIFSELRLSEYGDQVNIPHLVTLNKHISSSLKNQEDIARMPKIVFFQNLYILIIKASLTKLTTDKFSSDVSILESTIRDLDNNLDDNFADNLLKFIKSVKQFKQPTTDAFREIFKSLLEVFIILNDNHPDVVNDIFVNKDTKNDILLKIFKESLKNEKILCDFWRYEMAEETQFASFCNDFLGGFPYEKLNFMKVVNAILGSKLYPFADEVIEVLSKLSKVTFEMNNRNEASYKDLSKSKNRLNSDGFEFRSPLALPNDLVIPEGTMVTQKFGYYNVYEANIVINFWEQMFKDLSEFVVSNQGIRKIIMPDYIGKYLKLISKILIVAPNLAQKMQDMMLNLQKPQLNIEPTSDIEGAPILYFAIFDAFRLIHDRPEYSKISCLILQSIQSLLISRHTSAVLFFSKLYPVVSDTDVNPIHIFIDFYNSFRNSEIGDIDNFRSYERFFYKSLTSIVNIFKTIIMDEDIWVSSLVGSSDMWSKDSIPAQVTADSLLKKLAELYLDLTNENSWFERSEEVRSAFQDLLNLREFVSTNILNEIWETLLIPLCRRFLKDDFDVTHENVRYKYNLYQALFELINGFLLKINHAHSKLAIKVQDSKDDLKSRLRVKFMEYLDSLPLREMMIEAFEVTIDSSKMNMPLIATQKGFLGIVNKHYAINVEQRKNFLGETHILDFIATSLETLALVAKTCRLELDGADKKDESNLLKGFYKDFCYRESLYKYRYDSFSDNQSVNIIVAIISALILENERDKLKFAQKAVTIQNSVAPYSNYDWQYSEQLFPEMHDGNKFLFFISLDLLSSRALESPMMVEKPRSVVEAGLGALNQILHFWHTQSKVKKPNLEDYVMGLYNDLPNGRIIMDKFALTLTTAINEGHSSAFDFLLQLQEFQPRFLEDYLRVGENKEAKAKNPLINLLVTSLKNLSGMSNINKLTFKFLNPRENLFKLSLFILRILRSKRISKTIIDQLWLSTFDILVEYIFKHISHQKEPFSSIIEFLHDYLITDKLDFLDWNPSFNWTFNTLKLYHLTKLNNLQDKVLSELMDLVCWAFIEKLSKKNVHFIDRHASIFFKHYSHYSQRVIENLISENVLNGHKLMSVIQNEILEEILIDINTKLSGNRRNLNQYKASFINTVQMNTEQRITFVQNVTQRNPSDGTKSMRDEIKHSFDTFAIYLVLRSQGLSQVDSNKLSYICSFYNQVESVMVSKAKAQAKLFQFLDIIYSVGLEGNYGASLFNLSPSIDVGRYISGQCNRLSSLNNMYAGVSYQLLNNQFMSLLSKNIDPFSENTQLNTDFNMQNTEKSFLIPFASKTNILNFSLINVLLKDAVPRITETTVVSLFDSMTNRLSLNEVLLEYFLRTFLKTDTFNTNFSNVSYDVLTQIVRLSNSNLLLTAYLVANLQQVKERDLQNLASVIEGYIKMLSESIPLVLHFYKTLTADIEPFINSLLYAFFILKLLKKSVQPDIISPVIELSNTVLIKSKDLVHIVLYLIDCIYSTNSDQLQINDINQLSERLTRTDISAAEFNLLVQILTNFAVNGDNKQKILSSNVFKNILQIQVISASRNFQQGILYHHQLPDESHSMFCHLLALVSFLIQMHKDTPSILHFGLSFITKYQKRYELILGIGTVNDNDRSQPFDLTIQYQNQAFLEELTLLLANLALITQESDFWMNKNKYQFFGFLHLLTTRTIKIFSHELFNQNFNSTRFSQFLAVSDRFNPISRFEAQLQNIVLKSMIQTIPLRPPGSIMKSTYDPKTSIHSELNRFKDFKNVFLTQSTHTSNLFAFKLENLVSESIFNIGLAIASMMEVADFEEIYRDPSNNAFDDLFFRNFNHTLIDIQLFLLYAYQKLSIYPETYKDGCLHMQMAAASAEAKIQTRGVSTLTVIYALPEMKNIVRKAFETSFYLQTLSFQIFDRVDIRNKHFYIDELKKQQEKSRMLLQDFESYLARKENISSSMQPRDTTKFYSPIKSPYKSVAKFTPRNIAHELTGIDEEAGQRMLVNARSLETHVKFLEFIRNYYNLK